MAAQQLDRDNERQRIKDLMRDANAAESRGDGQAALTLLRQALVLAPQHQGLVASIVRILLARDEVQEAADLAESLVAADPASVPGLIALASCQRYRRQLPEAIATYERAATLDPSHPGVQAALATLGHRSITTNAYAEAAVGTLIDKAERNYGEQDFAKALVNFRQALALHPGNPDLLAASARCQRQLGQVDQAEALLQQSLQEHPNQFSLLLGLAELEADRGHWWVATDWYARARAADPAAPGLEEATEQSRAAASALPRRLMLVLGMHRSGSSATAGLLCGHGFQAPLPAHTAPASDSDPSGHWQAKPVVSAHDTLLEEQGLGWADSFLPTTAWEATLLPRHGDAIGEALRLAFDNGSFAERILVVQDPHQCRLQPIWNRVLEQHGLEAAVVLQQRHPLAVARSLLQRDRLPANRSLLLWLQHSLAAERHTRNLPRLIVDYDQVMADPGAVLARCQELWPQHHFDGPGASADSALIPAIDPSLNHAGPDPAADMAELGAYDPQLLELALAAHGTLLGPEECRSGLLDEAWRRLKEYQPQELGPVGALPKSDSPRIAAIVHLYHKDAFTGLADLLACINDIADLFVTGPYPQSDPDIISFLSKFSSTRYFQIDNKGRDARAFMKVFDLVKSYPACLKIHTKKGKHALGNLWKRALYNSCIGSLEQCNEIIESFNKDPNLSLIGSLDLYKSGPHWIMGNGNHIKSILSTCYANFSELPSEWGFIAGTVFWFRPAHYAKLFQCNHDDYFLAEKGLQDGAPEHAFERLFGLIPTIEGYHIKLVKTDWRTGEQNIVSIEHATDSMLDPSKTLESINNSLKQFHALAGSIDAISERRIEGWMACLNDSLQRRARIVIDDADCIDFVADEYRADLESAKINDGKCAFSVSIPDHYLDGNEHSFSLHDVQSDVRVFEKKFTPNATVRKFADFRGYLKAAYTIPEILSPFAEADYRVLGSMEAFADYLAANSKKEIKFSIIMPAYNRESCVLEAINSVLEQTHSNFELIIIDDGSSDQTRKILYSLDDQRIVLRLLDHNQGVSAARNAGLSIAQGDYIAYLDSDNTCNNKTLGSCRGSH